MATATGHAASPRRRAQQAAAASQSPGCRHASRSQVAGQRAERRRHPPAQPVAGEVLRRAGSLRCQLADERERWPIRSTSPTARTTVAAMKPASPAATAYPTCPSRAARSRRRSATLAGATRRLRPVGRSSGCVRTTTGTETVSSDREPGRADAMAGEREREGDERLQVAGGEDHVGGERAGPAAGCARAARGRPGLPPRGRARSGGEPAEPPRPRRPRQLDRVHHEQEADADGSHHRGEQPGCQRRHRQDGAERPERGRSQLRVDGVGDQRLARRLVDLERRGRAGSRRPSPAGSVVLAAIAS